MIDYSGQLRNYRQDSGFENYDEPFLVNNSGYQKMLTRNTFTFREKGRLDYLMLFVLSGRGTFEINGQEKIIRQNQCVLYKPHQMQKYNFLCEDEPEVFWIHFTGNSIEALLSKAGINAGTAYNFNNPEHISNLFKKIITELQIKKPMFEGFVISSFIELISYVGRENLNFQQKEGSVNRDRLDEVLRKLHKDYNKNLKLEELSKICSLSKYRFLHVFKEHTGFSPMEYLKHIRVEKAKDLLLSSSLSVAEISQIVGYENQLYFSRVFKSIEGISPNNFRKHALG